MASGARRTQLFTAYMHTTWVGLRVQQLTNSAERALQNYQGNLRA
jgi:hypothetical protein